jgi:Tfp pilus assembly protein PilF
VAAFLQGTEYAYRAMPGGRQYFERAVRLDSAFIAPRVWLISGLVAEHDTAAAREHLGVLQSLEATATPFEQAMIGWAKAVFKGDLDAKVRHLRVALGYSPRNNVLLYNLGATLESMGRVQEAVDPIREAVESRWRFPPLYTLWGVVAIETGQLDGLRQTLEGAQNAPPQSPYLAGLLEALALFDGDSDGARRYSAVFRAQIGEAGLGAALSEFVPIYRSLAQRARERGQARTAATLLQRAVDAEPSLPTARLELARLLAEAGDRTRAESLYRSAIVREPDAADVVYLAGEVGALLGRQQDARRYLTRYLALAPDGPQTVQARELLRSLGRRPGRD